MSCTNINFVSTLTSVTSQAEMEFILSKMRIVVSGYSPHVYPQLTLTSTRARQSSSAGLEGTWSWMDYKVGTNQNTASGHVAAVLTADWLQVWEYDNWQGDEPNGGEEENCLEMVGYAEGDKAAGWWNDIHCSHNKTRSYVCSYDNGTAR